MAFESGPMLLYQLLQVAAKVCFYLHLLLLVIACASSSPSTSSSTLSSSSSSSSSVAAAVTGESNIDWNDSIYNKSACIARPHSYNNKTTRAPDLFRAQFTLTTTHQVQPQQHEKEQKVTTLSTTHISTMMIQFNRTWSPIGVDRMYALLLDQYFDCAIFFRVVPNFIIQFGIAAEPSETNKWDDTIDDDPMHVQSNIRGTMSFATAGPQTRTTQLFINTHDNQRYLDAMGFTPIGIVINDDDDTSASAMDTVVPYIAQPNIPPDDNEDGINQDQYMKYGNEWVLKHYPNVDLIINTTLVVADDDHNNNNISNNIIPNEESETTTTTMIGRISNHNENEPPPPTDEQQQQQQSHRFPNRQYDTGCD